MRDHARLGHLGRRIDDAAQHAVGADAVPLHAAGIDRGRRVPSSGPPSLWKYHHGTPFTPMTTVVSGPNRGCIAGTTAGTEWAFSVTMT